MDMALAAVIMVHAWVSGSLYFNMNPLTDFVIED
jgi:hypothetical protein